MGLSDSATKAQKTLGLPWKQKKWTMCLPLDFTNLMNRTFTWTAV